MTTNDKVLGVLLMAYGSPDSLEDVEAYYTHIRRGRRPSDELIKELQERYRLVGGRTPLSDISEAVRTGLEERLNATGERPFRVILGMKHWHPYIAQAVDELSAEGIDRAIGLVLAPHYSRGSIEGYYSYIEQAKETLGASIQIDRIDSWHLFEPYLQAVARRIQTRLAEFLCGSDVTVVFTAHSLPVKVVVEGDPYAVQLQETATAIATMLKLPHWTFSYQSAGRTADPWLGPDLVETIHTLADEGVQHILVASIGFVSDHLEIQYDIDYEAQAAARERGITLKRTEMLNASPDFLDALTELVLQRAHQVPEPA